MGGKAQTSRNEIKRSETWLVATALFHCFASAGVYNRSHQCLIGSLGRCGTRQQGGFQAFGELMPLIDETGSSVIPMQAPQPPQQSVSVKS